MQVLLVCAVGILNIVCFLIGVRVGSRCEKTEEKRDDAPAKDKKTLVDLLVEKRQDHFRKEQEKEVQIEEDRKRRILANIENYDGTDFGQVEV